MTLCQEDAASAAAPVLAFPNTPEQRLRLALRGLETALEDQRAAVAGFRRDLGELGEAIARLGTSAAGLRDSLGGAAAEAARASRASRELMVSAEKLEAASSR
jgi:hypothetical protein